ncbi:MAG: SHOCT domain-containing protein [Sedimentibacter sp.]|uniref:SHOCT domain-containing protein n=1 Tax=Sedimentibacter sp. TaxID=1960295 RepID=UPI003158B8FF
MIFIWIVIGLLIYYMYKNNAQTSIDAPKRSNAEEILKERYVSGEIDDETYEKMKKTIKE